MSINTNFNKDQSIIMDDNSNINNRLKTETSSKTLEYQSPIGQEAEFNLDLNGEVRKSPKEKRTAICWNCESLLIVKNGWDIVECSECHKLNRIRNYNNKAINLRASSITKSHSSLNQDVPYIYGIVVCPMCETEIKFRKDLNNVTCYKCGYNINLNNNLFNSYNQNTFGNNLISRSYDFSSPIRYVNNPYYPNVIQLRGLMPFPPMMECHGSCTECTLNKILKALKKKPKDTYIPYPMFPYRYEEPQQEVRYVPINTETKKVKPDDEYKIVIRKKPKDRNSQSLGKYNLPKNKAFEKVFFSKLK